jgi:hypothetical protein
MKLFKTLAVQLQVSRPQVRFKMYRPAANLTVW